MQFPVPQFTDVEDKIIGSLTFKQFGIIFGAGIVVFLFYSITKSIGVLIFFAIMVGLPAIGLAFAKINGKPMYHFITHFIKFLTAPKVLVFHKEARNMSSQTKLKDAEITKPVLMEAKPVQDTKSRIKEINKLLEQKAAEEKEILKQV